MELIGKVVQLGTLTEGNSARGPWKKQELIIETIEQYPKKVCVMCWNERVNEINSFFVGQTLRIQFRVESREFNGRWYTDVTAFRFDTEPMAQPVAQQPVVGGSVPQAQQPLPPMNDAYFASSTDNGDDLPF